MYLKNFLSKTSKKMENFLLNSLSSFFSFLPIILCLGRTLSVFHEWSMVAWVLVYCCLVDESKNVNQERKRERMEKYSFLFAFDSKVLISAKIQRSCFCHRRTNGCEVWFFNLPHQLKIFFFLFSFAAVVALPLFPFSSSYPMSHWNKSPSPQLLYSFRVDDVVQFFFAIVTSVPYVQFVVIVFY